ncbi:unnamed protein product [Closterium sp. Naga37s-1]|nr:unnamed protein product [Closterium sp. Naga37s-1]
MEMLITGRAAQSAFPATQPPSVASGSVRLSPLGALAFSPQQLTSAMCYHMRLTAVRPFGAFWTASHYCLVLPCLVRGGEERGGETAEDWREADGRRREGGRGANAGREGEGVDAGEQGGGADGMSRGGDDDMTRFLMGRVDWETVDRDAPATTPLLVSAHGPVDEQELHGMVALPNKPPATATTPLLVPARAPASTPSLMCARGPVEEQEVHGMVACAVHSRLVYQLVGRDPEGRTAHSDFVGPHGGTFQQYFRNQ